MRKKLEPLAREIFGLKVERRQALKGLGALAVTGPAFAAISCGTDAGGGVATGGVTGNSGTGGAATGGAAPQSTGGAAMQSTGGAAMQSTGGVATQNTGGAAPQTSGGSAQSSGGTTGGSAQSNGGSAGQANGGQAGGAQTGGQANGGQTGGGQAGQGQTGGGQAGQGQAGSGGSGGGTLTVPPWDMVPMCTASKTDGAGQGPFFIHDGEKSDDVSLVRQDIRGRYNQAAEPGIEMQLHLRILDSKSTSCNATPVPNVEVYIWHTDAQGYYSGFGMPGEQKPDTPYAGVPGQNDLDVVERFCRGAQTTDANGVVSFRSIYPGWYNGRDLHIHFVCFKKGSSSRGRTSYTKSNEPMWLFTTQFYFDPVFSKSVHEAFEPYKRRTALSAYENAMKADEANNSGLRAKASLSGEIVTAQMQILLNPA